MGLRRREPIVLSRSAVLSIFGIKLRSRGPNIHFARKIKNLFQISLPNFEDSILQIDPFDRENWRVGGVAFEEKGEDAIGWGDVYPLTGPVSRSDVMPRCVPIPVPNNARGEQ